MLHPATIKMQNIGNVQKIRKIGNKKNSAHVPTEIQKVPENQNWY